MGLEYIISCEIYCGDKFLKGIDIGYWRKCFSLRNAIQELIHSDKTKDCIISINEDGYTACTVDILPILIEDLTNRLRNISDYAWCDSIWSRDKVRANTCKELAKICYAASLFCENENEDIPETSIEYAAYELDTDEDDLYKIVKNPDEYKIVIGFHNSY